jgi:hypothetical protein
LSAASICWTFIVVDGQRPLDLTLIVDNLFDRRAPIYGSNGGVIGTNATNLRPRTDISSPARVTVPGNFSYLVPRKYPLSAKLTF